MAELGPINQAVSGVCSMAIIDRPVYRVTYRTSVTSFDERVRVMRQVLHRRTAGRCCAAGRDAVDSDSAPYRSSLRSRRGRPPATTTYANGEPSGNARTIRSDLSRLQRAT
ncbi:hypothetical protein GCM10027290_53330 [Micromonospora sonneratiae]